MEPKNQLSKPCPVCGGVLVVEATENVGRRDVEAEISRRQRFWIVACAACDERFTYEPDAERLQALNQ